MYEEIAREDNFKMNILKEFQIIPVDCFNFSHLNPPPPQEM